jgi:hypothetical protein
MNRIQLMESYADQNELNYKDLVQAVQQGRVELYIERSAGG